MLRAEALDLPIDLHQLSLPDPTPFADAQARGSAPEADLFIGARLWVLNGARSLDAALLGRKARRPAGHVLSGCARARNLNLTRRLGANLGVGVQETASVALLFERRGRRGGAWKDPQWMPIKSR